MDTPTTPKLRGVFGIEGCCKAVWPLNPYEEEGLDLREALEQKARDTAADLLDQPDAAWAATCSSMFEFHATRTPQGIYAFVVVAGDASPQLLEETIQPAPSVRRLLSVEDLALALSPAATA
ncbi:hypothetical protein [Roseomonas chloroacetimidivorans]|uniref:hypothetical protein n=1 Tax=Roseomonas chloroacetimidivorans TaxID=1766656 RepID=UPI003C7159D0